MIVSGRRTVTTPGTALALGSRRVDGGLKIKALTTNAQLVYVGNNGSGDTDSTNGYPLAAGQEITFEKVGSLSEIIVDAAAGGEGVAWITLE